MDMHVGALILPPNETEQSVFSFDKDKEVTINDSYQSPVKKSAKKVKCKDKENSNIKCQRYYDSQTKGCKSSQPFADSTSKKSALANIDVYKQIPLTPNQGCKYVHTNEQEKNLRDQIKQLRKQMHQREQQFEKDKAMWL